TGGPPPPATAVKLTLHKTPDASWPRLGFPPPPSPPPVPFPPPPPPIGVAVDGKPLSDLPPSTVQMLGQTRRTPVATVGSAAVARHPTEWVILGGESVKFTVSRAKRQSAIE